MLVTLRNYQAEAVEKIKYSYRQGYKAPLLVLSTGSGKCLAKGTKIMLYDGTIKTVEQIMPGELLIGPDSKPRRVLNVCVGFGKLFEVKPTKGDPYVTNKEHVLSLVMTGKNCWRAGHKAGEPFNITVEEYLKKSKTFKHCAKGWRTGIDFPRHNDQLLLPAYFVGIWLGDGFSSMPSITTGDKEIKDYLESIAQNYGLKCRREFNSENSENIFLHTYRGNRGGNPITESLKKYGLLNNKHIPFRYKTGSRKERLSLLAGILDTDGYYNKCGYDLTLKPERLIDDIIFVARSLGFACYKSKTIKKCCNNNVSGTYWRTNINGDTDKIPCRILKKIAHKRRQKKNCLLTGIKISPVGEGNYYGFTIDGDGLFVLGDFTVTHNTIVFCNISERTAIKGNTVYILVHRDHLLRQTSDHLTLLGVPHGLIAPGHSMTGDPIQVASVWTLARRLHRMKPPALIIIDECFPAGVIVDGVPIEKIRVGYRVYSFNVGKNKVELKTVLKIFKNKPTALIKILLNNGQKIICTPGHPFYSEDKKRYIRAVDLTAGIRLKKQGGLSSLTRVDRIKILEPGSDGKFGGMCPDGYVYNIEVEGNNNYFADGVLVHNCHHTPAGTWKKILETWPSSRILGVTATPLRLDGKGLGIGAGGFFDTMIEGPDVRWFIDHNYLSQPLVYAPPTSIDLKGVRTQCGDYEKHELAFRMDKPTITGDAIKHYLRLCPNVPAILFAASVKHAEHSAEQFNAAGIPAASLTGELSDGMRKHRLQALATGQIKILTSCEIISEGTDIPIVTAAILLRPTQSTGMFLQQCGRAMRPFPGKTNAIILDHVGNCLRHGLPDDPRAWELNVGIMPGRNADKKIGPAIKTCEKCFAVYPKFLAACPQCGHVNAVNDREIKQVDGELEQLTSEHLEKMRTRRVQGMATDLAGLLAVARQRGYNPAWSHHVFNGRKAKEFKRGLSEQVRMAV
jgi:superfamily II DNA or RNA helicase